ncbi:MAG: heavy metal translocating P-type ATPase, partial [Acidobacteriota bacterium]
FEELWQTARDRVTREAEQTLAARIVRRVTEAGRRRARSERWVDRFALVYTPTVFAAAILTAVVPPLAGADWADWLYRSLALLVIGCPCALVIATPVSVVAGLASAARHGVLVKGGDVLERPANLRAVAFDKTGTLTRGALRLAEVFPFADSDERRVLSLAAALERRTSHPIGRAVVEAAAQRGIEPPAAADIRALPGLGVTGATERGQAWLGSPRLLAARGGESPEVMAAIRRAAAGGRTVVVVGEGAAPCGLLALEDAPRPTAAEAVRSLRRLGISRIALVTGDNPETAAAVAAAVGINDVRASLLPEGKVEAVDALRSPDPLPGSAAERRWVAFVGDGINDALALAAADVGIALGECATDAAMETADVTIISGDLRRVPWLIRHSRRVVAVIRANVAAALAVKAAFVVLIAIGHASLWLAIAADMGVSLLVIANSLRLLRG